MPSYTQALQEFFHTLGTRRQMVLATSAQDRTTARMVSCIVSDQKIYFQTDMAFLKYRQIMANGRVALCIDNIQIEAEARAVGRPTEDANAFFLDAFRKAYPGSYEAYSRHHSEVVIEVILKRITVWEYEQRVPVIKVLDLVEEQYTEQVYRTTQDRGASLNFP
ncbi:MAG: pyridoxamine 5'-phosphate oxidase family protein [Sphaerochaeta sp.]|nr:pyridoxamine 5'-phosphate oxidase family protein [Sphaerochaeta sp.]